MNEIWKDIEGYKGKYQVSNLGRVKSLNYHMTGNERILNPQKNRLEYLHVTLCKEGKYKHFYVHRLVASAFIENPSNYKEVNHKDEDKTNNIAANLEWCDRKYNNSYGTRNEIVGIALTNRNDLSKEVKCIETDVVYSSIMEAYRETDINQASISKCCLGKRKTAGGFHWKYI